MERSTVRDGRSQLESKSSSFASSQKYIFCSFFPSEVIEIIYLAKGKLSRQQTSPLDLFISFFFVVNRCSKEKSDAADLWNNSDCCSFFPLFESQPRKQRNFFFL